MISGFIFVIVIIALFFIIALAWRFGSHRYTLPCPVWMKWLLDPPFLGSMSRRTRKTIQYLDLTSGMNVLDAGCGPGRLTIPIATIVGPYGNITAMDIQEGMLQEVQKRANKENLTNISFIRVGIGEGTLESNYYDRATLITVLGEIPDQKAVLQDIFEALKPGGILLVEETIRDPHFQTRNTVNKLAGACGFIEKDFFGNRFSYILTLKKPSDP